ncbi:hypothetical protein GCM10027447_06410 [Glycomyces halotolerans]
MAVIDSDLTEIMPVVSEVDTALKIETDAGAEILIIEPQSKPPTRAKRRAWHWYLSYFEAQFDIPATLTILTADRSPRPPAEGP